MEFLAEMEPSLRALWYIALPTSMIFLLQTILTFMGSDSGDGVNADFDGNLEGAEAPFQLFTLRNLINSTEALGLGNSVSTPEVQVMPPS